MALVTITQSEFLKGYGGTNYFVRSLKSQWERKGELSEKQLAALDKVIANETKKQQKGTTDMPAKTATKQAKALDEIPSVEIEEMPAMDFSEQSSLFSLEPMLEEASNSPAESKETPMLDHIEQHLSKIAASVVEQTMERANKQLAIVTAKMNAITVNKTVMHVRVGETAVKQLSTEAHELLPHLITCFKLGENILVKGPAGSGKTTLGHQLAEALGLGFGHLCLSAGVSETWLYGRQLPTGFVEGEFSKFYRNGGVFLLDEIDAADANLLLSINTALANSHLYNPILGEKIERHKDFHCIAAANTYGLGGDAQYTGRNRLDAATLDRFVTFDIEYNESLEKKLCPDAKLLKKLHSARKELNKRNAKQIISTRAIARIYKLVGAGFNEQEAIKTLTRSWPKGLAEEINLKQEAADF